APPARSWSGPDAFRHHARPGGPTGGALRPCSPISRQRIESSPTVTGARGHGRRPSARRVHAARGSTCWVVAWAPSSLGMSPPTNPVRFRVPNGILQQQRMTLLNDVRKIAVVSIEIKAMQLRQGAEFHLNSHLKVAATVHD